MYIQCPHCNAIFSLPGSIDVSNNDARMRCGECSTVFHIAAHITTAPQDPSQPHFNFDQVLSGEEQSDEASFFDTAATSENTIYDNLEDTIELVVDHAAETRDASEQTDDSLADTHHDLPFEADTTTTLFLDETNQTSVDDTNRERLGESSEHNDEWQMPQPVKPSEQPKDNQPEDAFEEFIRKNQIEPESHQRDISGAHTGITSKQSGELLNDKSNVLPDIDDFEAGTEVERTDQSVYDTMKPSDTELAENDTEASRSLWDDVPTLDNLQLVTETEVEATLQSKQSGNDPLQTSTEPTTTAVGEQSIFEADEDELKKQASLALEIQEDLLDEGYLYEDDYVPLLDAAGNPLQEITNNTDDKPEEIHEALNDGEFTPADTLISLKQDDFLAAENKYTPQEAPYDNKHLGLFAGLVAILALLFGGQYIYNNRLDLVSSPSARPLVAGVCKIAGCDLYSARLPHLIETLSKSTYKHAQKENILVIESNFRNAANRPQPYPVFEVQFSDINLNTVAFRRFGPSEYLPFLPNDGLMDSDETVELRIEVADPGQQSTSFKFNFL